LIHIQRLIKLTICCAHLLSALSFVCGHCTWVGSIIINQYWFNYGLLQLLSVNAMRRTTAKSRNPRGNKKFKQFSSDANLIKSQNLWASSGWGCRHWHAHTRAPMKIQIETQYTYRWEIHRYFQYGHRLTRLTRVPWTQNSTNEDTTGGVSGGL